MNFLIKLTYAIFVIIGLFLFTYLSFKILIDKDMQLISALAILVSAFLATLSVQLSISNSKKIVDDEEKYKKEKSLLHLLYLINLLKSTLKEYEITHNNINQNINDLIQIDYKNMLFEDSKNLTHHLHSLEKIDLLYDVNNTVSSKIIKLCIFISSLIRINNLVINYQKLEEPQWDYHFKDIQGLDLLVLNYIIEIEELITPLLPRDKIFENIFSDMLITRDN